MAHHLSPSIALFLSANAPLPEYWPYGRRFRGHRISTLPAWYQEKVMTWPGLPLRYRAALRAAEGFRAMAYDQAEGRH